MTDAPETIAVLALHDDPAMLKGIERVLSNTTLSLPEGALRVNCRTVLLTRASDTAALLRDSAADVLLLDFVAPRSSGLQTLKTLGARSADMLPIMLMAGASLQSAADAMRRGAFEVLPKPFTPADLRYAVRRAAQRIVLARRARRLEAEKKQVRFDFIRVLGHELKAPLGAVATNIGVIKGHYLGDGIAAYDDLLMRCELRLDQMHKLIVDLLDMTRLESGQKKRDLQPLDLRAVAADAIELAAPQAKQRNISLRLESPPALPFTADRGEMDMVFNNLISNAVKYNRDGGEVHVVLAGGPAGVEIRVRDTGIGIAPEDVKKLFGEFVRIRNKQTAGVLGSGLGLSILRRLAEMYAGGVSVDSVPGQGSTFTVRLGAPAAAESAPAQTAGRAA